ncbi:hypothetical protein [Actinomadura nitritigenes]|uniref:hypothetical protein n=1 Tax=Actinomadura nitritigenes TaxID=134602 RepID=UPI003D905ABB
MLDLIRTCPDHRGDGLADTTALAAITTMADRARIALRLRAEPIVGVDGFSEPREHRAASWGRAA